MRVAAALVLAPLAIAIAYAGGWLWAGARDAGSDRPLCRMADDRGARARRACWRLALSGWRLRACCLAMGRIDASLLVLVVGLRRRHPALAGSAPLDRGGICLCGGGAEVASIAGASRSGLWICRADPGPAGGVGDRHRRLFCGPPHRRTQTLAAGQPEEDLGRRDRRFCGEPCRRRRICRSWFRQNRRLFCCWAPCSRLLPSSAISSSPR